MTVEIRAVDWEHPDGVRLRAAQESEVAERYRDIEGSEPGPKPTGADMSYFAIALRDGAAIGCGGLRALDARHGEVKRMYVAPEHRGTGVSTALLRHLEAEARRRGWERLVLETGDRQPDAMRLYEREGYTRIPNFGYYADSEWSRCYELRLTE